MNNNRDQDGDQLDPTLSRAAWQLGIEESTGWLKRAAQTSREILDAAQDHITNEVPVARAGKLDVVVHGSFARYEALYESDFDYAVIAHGLPENIRATRELLQAVDTFIEEKLASGSEGDDEAERLHPGRTGLFGRIASAPDLTERIGLEQDTNASHTLRLLLLEESVSIYQPQLRKQLITAVLDRYLVDYAQPKSGPPRFLLNDVIRYWYTLTVDYQAKRWRDRDRGWGLRYLKLLISRKLSYVGALVPLLSCDENRPASRELLQEQFNIPPLARIASLGLREDFEEHDALRRVIEIADEFIEFLSDRDNRKQAEAVSSGEQLSSDPNLNAVRELADELDERLTEILFGSVLGQHAQRYLVL